MKINLQTKKLSDLCNLFTDGDWIEKKDQSEEGIRLIQTGNVGSGYFKNRAEKARYISEKTFKRLNCTEILPGDCFVSRLPDPVGRACIIPEIGEKMITAVDCTIIRFKTDILPQWFVKYSLSDEYQNQINKEVGGATRQRISRKSLGQIYIPLPSITEQKRIVKVLDDFFEKIEKVKENTENNLKNSKVFFESFLQSFFVNLGKNLEEKRLGEFCLVIAGQSPEGKFYNKNGNGLPFYQGKKEFGEKYIGNPTTWTTKITKEAEKDDILMSVRAPVGPINFSTQKICIGRGLASIRAGKNINKDFIFWAISSKEKEIIGNVGAVFSSINKSDIENLKFFIPSLTEQKVIIKKLDELSAQTKKLEEIYKQKLVDLEELKKSILSKAFSGEL